MGTGAFLADFVVPREALVVRQRKFGNWFCETRVMRWLGKISYTAYILHFMVIGRFASYESTLRFEFPTILAITLALSSFVFYAVEQPFSKWARLRSRLGR